MGSVLFDPLPQLYTATSVSVCPMPRPTRKWVLGSIAVYRQYSLLSSLAIRLSPFFYVLHRSTNHRFELG